MKLSYEIVTRGDCRFIYLRCDPPQYLSAADLLAWMREVRDVDMDLFAEIFHAYNLLAKPG